MPPKPSMDDITAHLESTFNLSSFDTRFSSLENSAKNSEDQLAALANSINEIKLHLTRQPSNPPPFDLDSNFSFSPPPPPPLPSSIPRPPKLELPSFTGADPMDWIFQANNFFDYYQIPDDQRLPMISVYMRSEALSWFKWMKTNKQISTWSTFLSDLEMRFGPSTYENHQAMLFKLQQIGSVEAYQSSFERLSNCVDGLPADALLNCFISGLRPDIQREMALLQPTNITQAIGQAKLVEAKLLDSGQSYYPPPRAPSNSFPHHTDPFLPPSITPVQPLLPPPPTIPLLPAPPRPRQSGIPIRRLSPTEMQDRRTKGLCFNCDDKFSPGHKCTQPQFLSLLADDTADPLAFLDEPDLSDALPFRFSNSIRP